MEEIISDFINSEELLKKKIYKNMKYCKKNPSEINVCCTSEEQNLLIKIFFIIKKGLPYIKNKNLCLTIIFTYYGLVLGEQSDNYLFTSDLFEILPFNDAKNIIELFLILTTGSLVINNIDLSS